MLSSHNCGHLRGGKVCIIIYDDIVIEVSLGILLTGAEKPRLYCARSICAAVFEQDT